MGTLLQTSEFHSFKICSKICGKHFTKSQYSRDPARLAELGYPGARAALKDDAIP
jgi:hypothetical protein